MYELHFFKKAIHYWISRTQCLNKENIYRGVQLSVKMNVRRRKMSLYHILILSKIKNNMKFVLKTQFFIATYSYILG